MSKRDTITLPRAFRQKRSSDKVVRPFHSDQERSSDLHASRAPLPEVSGTDHQLAACNLGGGASPPTRHSVALFSTTYKT